MTDEERKIARKLSIKKYNDNNKERYKLYYLENKNKIKEKNDNIKDLKKSYGKEYYQRTKEYQIERAKKYRDENKDKIIYYRNKKTTKERKKIWYNEKRKNDPTFRLKTNIRSLIRISFKRFNCVKTNRTTFILGCSMDEFRTYIENHFEPWMNWKNYGLYNGTPNYGWDIDHIIPLSSYKTAEDIILLNHFNNLQPLCSYINRVIKIGKFHL